MGPLGRLAAAVVVPNAVFGERVVFDEINISWSNVGRSWEVGMTSGDKYCDFVIPMREALNSDLPLEEIFKREAEAAVRQTWGNSARVEWPTQNPMKGKDDDASD